MNKILYIIIGILLTINVLIIVSCDDFLSPTIEIFNDIENYIINVNDNGDNEKLNIQPQD